MTRPTQCSSTFEETRDFQFGVKVGRYRCSKVDGHDGEHFGELERVEERLDEYP